MVCSTRHWRRRRGVGTESRPHSSGAASGRHDANEHERDVTPLEVQVLTPDDHSTDGQRDACDADLGRCSDQDLYLYRRSN